MRSIALKFTLILCLAVFVTAAAEDDFFTQEDAYNLKSIGSVQMSPDSSTVLYSVSTQAEVGGKRTTEYYLVPAAGGKATLFFPATSKVSSVSWSPCSKFLFFTASLDGDRELYRIPVNGGGRIKMTTADMNVGSYKLSPDHKLLAYTAREDYDEETAKARKDGYDMKIVEENYLFSRLHVYNLATKEDKIVTTGEYNVSNYAWSPDSKQFVFAASDEASTDAGYMFTNLFTISVDGGERALLTEKQTGRMGSFAWSPSGKYIAWNGAVDISDPSPGSIFILNMETKALANLTKDRVQTVSSVRWLPEDKLVYSAIEYQEMALYSVNPDGSDEKLLLKSGNGTPVFRGYSICECGCSVALAGNTPSSYTQMYAGKLADGLKKMTDINPWMASKKLGKQEVIEWTAKDGWKIQGVLVYPVDYQEGTRYPMVVNPHGGPESTDMNGWYGSGTKWGQILAGKGYFVFMPNYRASTGRGVAFAKGNHRDLGGKEFQDVIDGIDYLVAKGMVDTDRVGSGGGSYGGYFSAIAATKWSERFAASVVFAGPASQYSKIGTTDTSWENAYVHYDLPQWWKEHDLIWKFSPVAYAENCKTPTLICHGEEDSRVPLGQAQELFRNIQVATDTTVRLVIYPRAGHGLREPAHRRDYTERALAWFDLYLESK
jgi:dipeptidyl aminopeptidase/acylaminoacyl peptidase